MWHPEHLYDGSGHLDEGVIHAWLDGALDRDAAREVEAHATACTTCSLRVEEARGFVAGASQILGALDDAPRVTPAAGIGSTGAVPKGAASPGPVATARERNGTGGNAKSRRARWSTRRWSLAAAAVFLLAAGSLVMRDRLGGSDGVRDVIVAERQAKTVEGPSAAPGSSTADAESAPIVTTPAPFSTGRGNPGSGGAARTTAKAASNPVAEEVGTSSRQSSASTAPASASPVASATALRVAESGGIGTRQSDLTATAPAPRVNEPVRHEGAVAAAVPAPSPSAAAGWNEVSAPEAARQRAAAKQARVSAKPPKVGAGDSMETRCWLVDASTTMLTLTGVAAPQGDAWRLGERMSGEKTEPIRWREEIGTAGRRFRIADPDSLRRAGLLLLVRGDSLFQMPAGPDRPVGPLRGVRVACPDRP